MSRVISDYKSEEETVFQAVQQYLNDNKILDRNNLVNYIKSHFSKISVNINEEGIKRNLETLIKKKRIVEGSKLTKDSVLQNLKRKRIYDLVISHPGIIFNEIIKNVEMSNHVVFWHIGMLLKFNLIRKTTIQTREIYYDSKMDEQDAKINYFKAKKESKRILNYLEINKVGVNKSTMASDLQMHPKTINKYLILLEEIGFVEKEKFSAKEILYFLKTS